MTDIIPRLYVPPVVERTAPQFLSLRLNATLNPGLQAVPIPNIRNVQGAFQFQTAVLSVRLNVSSAARLNFVGFGPEQNLSANLWDVQVLAARGARLVTGGGVGLRADSSNQDVSTAGANDAMAVFNFPELKDVVIPSWYPLQAFVEYGGTGPGDVVVSLSGWVFPQGNLA